MTLAEAGDITKAKRELNLTVDYLKQKGVNRPVLKEIEDYAKSLEKIRRKPR